MKRFVDNPEGLLKFLESLSNSRFRIASRELADSYLPSLSDEQYIEHFRVLFSASPKAYLGTLLKASKGRNLLENEKFKSFVPKMSQVDKTKIAKKLLSTASTPEEVEKILKGLSCDDLKFSLPLLLDLPTMPCGFVLVKILRYHEGEKRLLTKTAALLMNKGDKISFNIAALMKTAFQLNDLKGVFSLMLAPWELSKIETDYVFFCQKMSF